MKQIPGSPGKTNFFDECSGTTSNGKVRLTRTRTHDKLARLQMITRIFAHELNTGLAMVAMPFRMTQKGSARLHLGSQPRSRCPQHFVWVAIHLISGRQGSIPSKTLRALSKYLTSLSHMSNRSLLSVDTTWSKRNALDYL